MRAVHGGRVTHEDSHKVNEGQVGGDSIDHLRQDICNRNITISKEKSHGNYNKLMGVDHLTISLGKTLSLSKTPNEVSQGFIGGIPWSSLGEVVHDAPNELSERVVRHGLIGPSSRSTRGGGTCAGSSWAGALLGGSTLSRSIGLNISKI